MTEENEERPFCPINSLRPGITVYSGFYCGFLSFPLTPSLLPRGSSERLLAGVESHMRNSHRLRGDKQGDVRPIPGALPSGIPLCSASGFGHFVSRLLSEISLTSRPLPLPDWVVCLFCFLIPHALAGRPRSEPHLRTANLYFQLRLCPEFQNHGQVSAEPRAQGVALAPRVAQDQK